MSQRVRNQRARARYRPYRLDCRSTLAHLRLVGLTVVIAVSYLLLSSGLALLLGYHRLPSFVPAGYFMIAAYGLGIPLLHCLVRLCHIGQIFFSELRRTRKSFARLRQFQESAAN